MKHKSDALLDIYDRLFKEYGPQHWWPAQTRFEVIIGAILTQSAAWTNVEKAIDNLKLAGKLSAVAINDIDHDELARIIRPCGYYNVKAKKLKTFVLWLEENYNGNLDNLFALDTGELRIRLLAVKGVGEETADSIMLYAGAKPVFVIERLYKENNKSDRTYKCRGKLRWIPETFYGESWR